MVFCMNKSSEIKRMHVLVSGIVQGVFFRAHTEEWARSLELTGWVRNLQDGRVEIVAEGPEEDLNKLLEKVRKGPPSAKVTNVEVFWEDALGEFDYFGARSE